MVRQSDFDWQVSCDAHPDFLKHARAVVSGHAPVRLSRGTLRAVCPRALERRRQTTFRVGSS